MNHRVSKFTCLLLALLMVCTLLPATVFAEGGKANAAETPAAVQAFLSAVEAISIPEEINGETGPALNAQIGAAQDAYDALSEEELAREDVQAAAAVMQQAADALTGGAELMVLDTGHSVAVRFVVLYVGEEFNIGYSYGDSESTTFICQYSTSHSDTAYNNHTIAISDIKAASQRLSIKDGYEVKGWTKTSGSNPTIHSFSPGTTACNKGDTIYIVAKRTAPVYYSYKVNHVYRTNGVQDGTYTQSLQAEAGTTVYASNITKVPSYNDITYNYTNADHNSAKITGNGTVFNLYYDRTEVPVPTPPNKPSDDDVITVLDPSVKVNAVCNTNAEHKQKYDVLEGSFTVGDVQGEGTDANPFIVTVTVKAEKYVEQFNNEFSGATHEIVGDNAKNITLKFVGGNWVVDGTSDVTFTVQEKSDKPEQPETPTFEQISDALFVELICTNKPDHSVYFKEEQFTAGAHGEYKGKLIEDSITVGDVEWDTTLGKWVCDITVDYTPYLAAMNEKHTDLQHRLADSQPPTKTVTLAYQPNSINMPWFVPVKQRAHTINNIIHPVTFNVTCDAPSPVYPKEYCYIDATATGGGSISPKGTVRVPVYDDQTFYMLAEPGYVLVDVLVDGVSIGAVGSYTFRSVTRHHTIHAVFQPLSALPPQTGGDSTAVLFLGMGLILTACAAFVCLHRRKEN